MGADKDVLLTLSARDEDLQRALNKANKEIDRLKAGLKDLKDQGKKTNDEAVSGFDEVAGRVVKYISVIGLARAAWGQLLTEIERVKSAQRDALQTQLDVNASRQLIAANMPGATAGDVSRMQSAGTRIAKASGVSESVVNQALAEALSASGGNMGASEKAVSRAAKNFAFAPGSISMAAGAMLDLSRVTGTDDAAVNFGFLQAIAGKSRVADPRSQAKNIAPAIIGAVGGGLTPSEAGGLFAALSTATGDVTGERTGTATIQLVEQLRAAYHKEGAFKKTSVFPADADTFSEQLSFLQGDEKARKRFLDKASFEAKSKGAIRSLLTDPNSSVSTELRSAIATMPDQAGMRALNDQYVRNLQVDPLEATAGANRTFKTFSEQLRTTNTTGGMSAALRDGLLSTLRDAGQSDLAEKITSMQLDVVTNVGRKQSTDAVIGVLNNYIQGLLNPTPQLSGVLGLPHYPSGYKVGDNGQVIAPEREREIATLLKEMVTELRQINGKTKDRPAAGPTLSQPNSETGRPPVR